MIIAHRGASALAPENTLSAFKLALNHGSHGIEFDVSTLGDGTPAILHDATTTRCSSTNIPIDQLTKPDLSDIDAGSWFDHRYAGETIPLFSTVLDWLETQTLIANIEIKRHPHQQDIEAFIQPIIRTLLTYPELWPKLLIGSFDQESLQYCRRASPELNLGVLYETPPDHWLSQLQQLQANNLHIKFTSLSEDILGTAKEHNINVYCYTPSDPEFYRHWAPLGLTGVIVDNPKHFLEYIQEYN